LLVARRCLARPRSRTHVPARKRLPALGRSVDAAHHRARALFDQRAKLKARSLHQPICADRARRVPTPSLNALLLSPRINNVRRRL
jgi:hypothetical protein